MAYGLYRQRPTLDLIISPSGLPFYSLWLTRIMENDGSARSRQDCW